MNQDISRDVYEVIVVKNFEDQELDEFIDSNGFRRILAGNDPVGIFLSIGVEEAKGEIVSFLEDDDIFTHDKISWIVRVFENQKVVYYHNSYNVIDENGKEIDYTFFSVVREQVNLLIDSTLNLTKQLKFHNIHDVGSFYFNPSCVSMRRSILVLSAPFLRRLVSHADDFLFFSAMNFGDNKVAMIDNKRLTFYRKHGSTSADNKLKQRALSLLELYESGSKLIDEMVEQTQFAVFTKCQFITARTERYVWNGDVKSFFGILKPYVKCLRFNNYPYYHIAARCILLYMQILMPHQSKRLQDSLSNFFERLKI